LQLEHGYPAVYRHWLANVLHYRVEDLVVPVPQTSLLAAKYFLAANVRADLVYIDASHEELDVLDDMRHYFHVLRGPRSAMVGDDWNWPTVRAAVTTFAQTYCASGVAAVDVQPPPSPKWVLRKGACTGRNGTIPNGPDIERPTLVYVPPADEWAAVAPVVHNEPGVRLRVGEAATSR